MTISNNTFTSKIAHTRPPTPLHHSWNRNTIPPSSITSYLQQGVAVDAAVDLPLQVLLHLCHPFLHIFQICTPPAAAFPMSLILPLPLLLSPQLLCSQESHERLQVAECQAVLPHLLPQGGAAGDSLRRVGGGEEGGSRGGGGGVGRQGVGRRRARGVEEQDERQPHLGS